jgi:hypothetical protein
MEQVLLLPGQDLQVVKAVRFFTLHPVTSPSFVVIPPEPL